MARYRPAPTPVDVPTVPARLLRCHVEDWVALDEVPGIRAGLQTNFVNGRLAADDEGEVAHAVLMIGRRRHRDARWAWAEENGIDVRALSALAPTGRPVFRDYGEFARLAGPDRFTEPPAAAGGLAKRSTNNARAETE